MRKVKKMLAFGLSVLMLAGSLAVPNSKVNAQEQTSNIAVHKQVYTNTAEGGSTTVSELQVSRGGLSSGGTPVIMWQLSSEVSVEENSYLKDVQGLVPQQFVVDKLTINTSDGKQADWTKDELASNADVKLSGKLAVGSTIERLSVNAVTTEGLPMPERNTLSSIINTFENENGYIKSIKPVFIEKSGAGVVIENTGEELDLAQFKVKPYNPDEYGMIRFTLYKIDRAKLAAVKVEPSEIVKNDTYKEYLDESFTPVDKVVNAAGIANFTSVTQGDYVIAETVKPAAVVEPAQPMFVRLPVTNKTNDGFLSTVHLYPKNRVDDDKVTITVTKKGLSAEGETSEPVADAQFKLFYGKPGQDGQELQTVKTDSNGELKLSKLKPGPYYLVELPSENIDTLSNGQATKKYFVSPYLLDNGNNKAQIMVQPNGEITTSTDNDPAAPNTLALLNYSTPEGKKELINKSATEYDYNAPISFKSTFKYNFGTDQKNNNIYGNFRITDELSSQYAKILEDSVEITLYKGLSNNKLNKGKDYSLTVEGHKFTIEFAPSMVQYLSTGATTIQVDYKAVLTEKLEPNTKVTNKTSFLYNIGDVEKELKVSLTEAVTTYGKKFMKVDGGIFGTGVGSEGVPEAKFILRKELSEGKYTYWTNNGWQEFNSFDEFINSDSAKMFITTNSGELIIRGFEEGNYEVIEVEAPEGFDLDQTPVKFKLDINSWTAEEVQKIVNYKSADLPVTGKEWTAIVIGSTLVLLVVGGVFIVVGKKKDKKKED